MAPFGKPLLGSPDGTADAVVLRPLALEMEVDLRVVVEAYEEVVLAMLYRIS
jgi:hypothetical protein